MKSILSAIFSGGVRKHHHPDAYLAARRKAASTSPPIQMVWGVTGPQCDDGGEVLVGDAPAFVERDTE